MFVKGERGQKEYEMKQTKQVQYVEVRSHVTSRSRYSSVIYKCLSTDMNQDFLSPI